MIDVFITTDVKKLADSQINSSVPVHKIVSLLMSLLGTLCKHNIHVFDDRMKLIVTYSSSNSILVLGIPQISSSVKKQLIGRHTVNIIIAAGSSLPCRCTNPPTLWHAAAQLELVVSL